MFQRKPNEPSQAVRMTTAGQRFIESASLTTNLPKTLLAKSNGQLFQEIQMGATNGGAQSPNMVQQIEMLQRAEPVGGWESLINDNQELVLENALRLLEKRLAEPGRAESIKPLLDEIEQAVEKLKRELEEQRQQIEKRYEQVQTPLRRWQEEYGREPDLINRVLALAQTVLGGQLSLSEVVKLWNKRESLAKVRDAYRAASELLTRVAATVEEYARNLDGVILTARQRMQELETQIQTLTGDLDKTRLWTIQTDYTRIAEAFAAEETGTLTQVLAALREQGSEKLVEIVVDLARREAERELAPLNIVSLLEKEAAQLGMENAWDDLDPVVLVGENLLDQVRHQNPTWQLVAQAHPRVLVLQITPNGENVFDHPDLETARYGDRTDRLGFLEAQMDTALDEIQLMRDGADAFKQARAKREYFVLEPVVKALGDGKPSQAQTTPVVSIPSLDEIPKSAAPNLADGNGHLSNPVEIREVAQ